MPHESLMERTIPMRRLFSIAVLSVTGLGLLAGCPPKNPTGVDGESVDGTEAYRRAVTEKTLPDGIVLVEIDLNGDGVPEIFNHYRERADAPRLLVRKDADLNRDGKVDIQSWFDEQGKLEREDMDGDYDGKMDMWDYYQDVDNDGQPDRVSNERDTDNDGIPNIWTYYSGDGTPTRKERDTNGDGRIDVWEKFDEEGKVIKSGRDVDFDGAVDERDE